MGIGSNGSRTGLAGPVAGDPASSTGTVGSHASRVQAVLDLIRAPGATLRILEASGGSSRLQRGRGDVVSRFPVGNGGPAPAPDTFDCVVCVDLLHRLDPAHRHRTLLGMRRATRGAVVVEIPRASNGHDPLAETIDALGGFGDSILVLNDEHLPALFALRELDRSAAPDPDRPAPTRRAAPGASAATAGEARSIVISVADPDHPGIDLSLLEWCCSPAGAGREPSELAVLPLSLEVRRLSTRLDAERARADRAEAEGADLRRKLGELTRIASEDRAGREQAEELVEIVAAARGYRIGLALCNARQALRRRLASARLRLSAPWRAIVRGRTGDS